MALRFTTSSTNNVSLGTATTILPDTFTVLAWLLIRDFSGTVGYSIIERTTSTFADYRGVNINEGAAGRVGAFCRRGSPGFTGANVEAQVVRPHGWQFIAAQIEASGSTAANQKIFFGDEHNVAREPSTYISQTAGSGATSIQAGDTVRIGNNDGNNTSGFPGLIHFVGVWNRLLSKDEIAYWQSMTLRNRIKQSQGNTVFMYLNGGTGRQRDYSGAANHGTVTGAHAAALSPRAPAPRFYLFSPVSAPPPAKMDGMFFGAV